MKFIISDKKKRFKEKADLLALLYVMFSVTFPYGVQGQVWYLIISIPDLCILPYLNTRC